METEARKLEGGNEDTEMIRGKPGYQHPRRTMVPSYLVCDSGIAKSMECEKNDASDIEASIIRFVLDSVTASCGTRCTALHP
jgi:hypothetical protein